MKCFTLLLSILFSALFSTLFIALFSIVTAARLYADEALPELEISNIGQDVYQYKSYQDVQGYGRMSSNGLVVVDANRAFIVDTPWSVADTETLVSWIEVQGYELVGSVSTHSHEDRTAGIEWLNQHSVPTYASDLTNEILSSEGKELATHSFAALEHSLMGGSLQLFYPGEGHTRDNLVVWLPKSKILFGGCFVRSLGSKGLGYTGEASIESWADSAENVLIKYPDAEIVVPGHGAYGDISLLEHTKHLAASAAEKMAGSVQIH